MSTGTLLRAAWAVLFTAALGHAEGPAPTATPARELPPVVVISLDTLRADHVGAYGYDRDTTPNIDAFAKDAVLFESAFTPGGGTLPAHMTLLTGLAPEVHGVTAQSETRLDPGRETLAEILQKAGYRTAGFTGAGYVRARWGFDQGFDVFDDAGRGFEQILPKATAWLDSGKEPPFLFLHTLDIHSDWDRLPYDAPLPYRDRFVSEDAPDSFDGCRDERCASKLLAWLNQQSRKGKIDLKEYFTPEEVRYLIDLYDGGVAYTDARFGELLDELKKRGLYDEAIIVVVSDHGEEFLEHGLLLHEQIYDEVVRVPIMIKLPGGRHGGRRVSALVGLADVMPTALDAAGLAATSAVRGGSLLPVIEGNAEGRAFVHVWGIPEKLRAADWSLVRHEDGTFELYHLRRDPGETKNVAESHPGMTQALSRQLDSIRASLATSRQASKAPKKVDLPPEVVDQLKALGYLQD